MSIARYTLICSLKSAHREVRHSTNKRLIDCLGLHLESLFLFSTYKSVLEIKLQNAFLCLVPHTRGRSHRRQYRCRNPCRQYFLNTLTSNTKGQRFHLSKII